MIRTAFAQLLAPVAGAARPCGVFANSYVWRSDSMMHLQSINATATKRTARHLEMLTT